MTRKQFLVLLAVLVVLGAAGAWVMWSERAGWGISDTRVGQRLAPGLVVANVAEIRIQEAENGVTLHRKDGTWHVKERKDYPAYVERIGELLTKVAGLEVTQVQPLTDKLRPRFDLVEPGSGAKKNTGTVVELKNQDGKVAARLLVGKEVVRQTHTTAPTKGAPLPSGRYVQGADKDVVAIVSDPLENLSGNPAQWLARDLIRVHNAAVMTSLTPDGKVRWKVSRPDENADWKSVDPGPALDNDKIQDIVAVLIYVALADVAMDPSKAGFDEGVVLKVDTFHNTHYTIQLGRKEGDLRYFRVSLEGDPPKVRKPAPNETPEEKEKKDKQFAEDYKGQLEQLAREGRLKDWTFLVKEEDIRALLRDRSELLPEKKKEDRKS